MIVNDRDCSNRGMNEVDHMTNEQQLSHGSAIVEESDIPGFAYDSTTKRYYRVQPQASGPVSFLFLQF